MSKQKSNIHDSILELIGDTPLVKLNKINNGVAQVIVKLEYFNPSNSVKDRAALNMIEKAEQDGRINENTVIIEPTSGNTGVGLALVCAVKGYRFIAVMPESMSIERRKMISAYGADIILTPKEDGMKGSVKKAEQLAKEYGNSFIPMQFSNISNVESHNKTAEEIFRDTNGKIDIFVAAFGTGGTITGTAKRLKELKPEIKIVGIEPQESPLVTKGIAAPHGLQGIGANFVPEILDLKIIDEIVTISTNEAIETARNLAKKEGIFCGISSGANVKCALDLAKKEENKNKLIVAMTCDYGERYLSTTLVE